jgi:hypothetical protein
MNETGEIITLHRDHALIDSPAVVTDSRVDAKRLPTPFTLPFDPENPARCKRFTRQMILPKKEKRII